VDHHAQVLLRYGHALLSGAVFVERIGVPLPVAPILVAAGALAGSGRWSPSFVLLVSTVPALAADLIWYELGRRKGIRVLQFLCRLSLEPDSCVRRTEDSFARHGARALLIAKFVPGLSTVAPPLAGIFRMRLARFVGFDAGGTLLWAATFVGLGYAFTDQLEELAEHLPRVGGHLAALVAGALAAWIAWKFVRRRRFIRKLRIDRITPEELKRKIDSGEEVVIVDLRSSVDFEAEPLTIPGAVRLETGDLDGMRAELTSASEVVLYCS
jgi:membrane protein DedA with SNARE-associated domain